MKCKNPCIGACAPSSECKVVSHVPRCSCPVGYIGNPYSECTIQQGKLKFLKLFVFKPIYEIYIYLFIHNCISNTLIYVL